MEGKRHAMVLCIWVLRSWALVRCVEKTYSSARVYIPSDLAFCIVPIEYILPILGSKYLLVTRMEPLRVVYCVYFPRVVKF